MGVIRRQKASAVVGTPGVDDSLARGLGSLARSTFAIGQQMERNRAITDQVDTLKELQTTDEEVQKATTEIQARYNSDSSLDISNGIKEQKEAMSKIYARRITEVDNKRVRKQLTLKHEQNKIGRINTINKWGLKLQGINNLIKGNEVISGLSTQAEHISLDPDSPDTIENLLLQTEEITRTTANGLSPQEGAKFIENAPESVARSYLDGLMKRDPERALDEFREKGVFKTIFEDDDRRKIEKDIAEAINGQKLTTKMNGLLDGGESFKPFIEDLATGNLDPSEVANAEIKLGNSRDLTPGEKITFAHLRKVALTKKYQTKPDSAERVVNIKNRILRLGLKKDGSRTDADVTLEDLVEIAQDTWQAVGKDLSAASAGALLLPVYANMDALAAKREPGGRIASYLGFSGVSKIETLGLRQINNKLDSNSKLSKVKRDQIDNDMTIQYLSLLKNDKDRGIETTRGQAQEMLNGIFREADTKYRLEAIPEEGKPVIVKGVKLWQMPDGTFKTR